jgi:hypothetical protein
LKTYIKTWLFRYNIVQNYEEKPMANKRKTQNNM